MGLFGKKKEKEDEISKSSEEFVLKEELEKEVEQLQVNFRKKQEELGVSFLITKKITLKKILNL